MAYFTNIIREAVPRLSVGGLQLGAKARCYVSLLLRIRRYASFADIMREKVSADIKEWEVTVECVTALKDSESILQLVAAAEPCPVRFNINNGDWHGTAVPSEVKLSGMAGSKVRWQLTLKGRGSLSF